MGNVMRSRAQVWRVETKQGCRGVAVTRNERNLRLGAKAVKQRRNSISH